MSAARCLDGPAWTDEGGRLRPGVPATAVPPSEPEVGRPAALRPLTLGFVAHAGGRIALRPARPTPVGAALPRELGPGETLGDLAFADLAVAFQGVVELDLDTGRAVILDSSPDGAPRRLAFTVDKRGIVQLRGLDGHPWREDVPAGRPVFGLAPEVLCAAHAGELELDPARLQARLASPAPVPSRDDQPAASEGHHRERGGLVHLLVTGGAFLAIGMGGAGWWWSVHREPRLPSPAEAVAAEPATIPEAIPTPVLEETASVPSLASAEGSPPLAPPASPSDPLVALEALAGSTEPIELRADLGAIAAALRKERLARAEEQARAATLAIAAGGQLARAYRQDVLDVRRLETALGICGPDPTCRERYGPALARAADAREITLGAYIDLLTQVAATYPHALLEEQLAAFEARHGNLDAKGGASDLARRFVAQVARWREGPTGDHAALARELEQD